MAPLMLRTLAGTQIGELEFNVRTTGYEIKNQVAARWQIPPECQELCLGTKVLADREPITAGTCDGLGFSLTLIVSMDKAYRRLEDKSAKVRQRAVQALAHAVQRGDEVAIGAVGLLLEDPSAVVRGTVVKVFSRVPRGEAADAAVLVVCPHLESRDPDVRRAAVEALAHVASEHHGVEPALRARVEDTNSHVRLAATEVLARLPKRQRGTVSQTASCPAGDPLSMVGQTLDMTDSLSDTRQLHPQAAPASPVDSEHATLVARVMCPQSHVLSHFVVDEGGEASDGDSDGSGPLRGFECDGCDCPQAVGSIMFSCRQCDYDLCLTCAREMCG